MNIDYEIPQSWIEASDQERKDIANGCGPQGWKYDLIPDTVWGLYIGDICNWHDFEYEFSEKIPAGKKKADDNFYHNLKLRIWQKSNFLIWPFRRLRILWYYLAVSKAGNKHFMA